MGHAHDYDLDLAWPHHSLAMASGWDPGPMVQVPMGSRAPGPNPLAMAKAWPGQVMIMS